MTLPRDHLRTPSLGAWALSLFCVLLLFLGGMGQEAASAPVPHQDLPKPLGYVSDHAGVVTAEWKARIRSVCKDLERKTGVEMVVVTVDSIEPYAQVREYSGALFQYWKIGRAQQEHGVMVLAYSKRPQAAVTLGRNMLRVISPSLLEEATHRYIEPNFQVGNFGEGLYRTVVALATAAQDVRVGEAGKPRRRAAGLWIMVFTVVVVVGFFWLITRPDKRHPFRRIHREEFWGIGRGGFGGNFGSFGGAGSREPW